MVQRTALALALGVSLFAFACGSGEMPNVPPPRPSGNILTEDALIEAVHRVPGAASYQIRVDRVYGSDAEVLLNGEAFSVYLTLNDNRWEWESARTESGRLWTRSAAEVVRWFSEGKPPPKEPYWHQKR